jgi:hypothetical protein
MHILRKNIEDIKELALNAALIRVKLLGAGEYLVLLHGPHMLVVDEEQRLEKGKAPTCSPCAFFDSGRIGGLGIVDAL